MNTTKGVRATLDIREENGVWADLRIVNTGVRSVSVHNPGDYQATEGWAFSREAYNVAVLLSFHFLDMALTTAAGIRVDRSSIATRANHDVQPAIGLKPSDSLVISIPLHAYYRLERSTAYSRTVTYGNDELRVRAERVFEMS